MRRQRPRAEDGRTRAVGYVRVSTEQQADHGVSLEAQEAKLRQYAALYGLELVGVRVDAGESAKTLDRPALGSALEMLRSGRADALLVVKLDRLTRSVRDLGVLLESYFAPGRWALLSVSEQIDTRTAAGRMVLNILTSVAQWEREAIGERTSAAHRHKLSRGEYIGGDAPYGWRRDGGQLVPREDEQAVVRQARALRGQGASLRAIATRLEVHGYHSRTGKPFAAAQVARMVASTVRALV